MSMRTSSVRAAIRLRETVADAVSPVPSGRAELSSFSRLLLLLHESVLDSRRWQQFLEVIAHQLDGNAAVLVLQSPGTEGPRLVYTWGARRECEAAYSSHYFALDPFVQLPEGKVVTLHEMVPREQLERSEFYRGFLEPLDTVYNLGVDLQEEDRLHVRLRICRSARAGDFSPAERGYCALVVEHLRAAIRTHVELNLVRAERAAYADAMDHLTMATIFLDESGQVLHTNAVAQRILALRDGISQQDRTLALWHPQDTQRFRAAVTRAIETRRTGQPGIVDVLRVQRPSGRKELGMIIRPAPPFEAGEGGSLTAAVAVFLSADSIVRDPPTACVCKLFGLTRKEAMLALLLANGRTLQEAARELDISLNTARAHLRAIFAKTGIDRQTKLVRAILTSVATLG